MRRISLPVIVLVGGVLFSSAHAAPTTDVVSTDIGPLIDEAATHPNRFAVQVVHPASIATHGEWSSSGSTRTWTYVVRVPSAVSLSFHAPHFALPPSGSLTVSGSRGHATYRNTDASRGGLWSRPLVGDTLSLSVTVAAAEASQARLEIESVQAGYRSLGGGVPDHPRYRSALAQKATTTPSACTENYSCHITSDNQGPAEATVAILIGNVGQCTGTLLSDVRQDGAPYVLTARHCETGNLGGGNPDAANSVTVYWDAVSACAAGLGSLYDGVFQTQTGAVTMVEQQDAWLIRLDAPPRPTDAFYAGWDATGGVFAGGYSVHHALGYDKQYVAWSGQALLQTIPGSTLKVGYDSTFWGLVNSLGNVGAGASGGAVFDPSDNVVGSASLAQLVSGENSAGICPANPVPVPSPSNETALYTALSSVWSSNADATSSTGGATLQSVLDPDGAGKLVNSGYGNMPISLSVDNNGPTTFQTATLSWNVPGAQSCTAGGGLAGDGWSGAQPAAGSAHIGEVAGGAVTYSITCTAGNRVGHASITVSWIYIAPLVDLHTDIGPVMAGGIVYLFWSSNVSPCTASSGLSGDGWSGTKASQGSQDITVNQIGTVTYTLTCGTGARVATTQLPVSVVAPGVTLYADSTQITAAAGLQGSYVNAHWVGSGSGGNCVSTGGAPGDNWNFAGNNGSSSSVIIGETVPGTYTYTMTCTGGGRSSSSSVTVVFTNDAPAISLVATQPTQAIFPQTATNDQGTPNLAWASNVNGCFMGSLGPYNNSTSVDMHGQYPGGTASAVARIAGHYVYTLYCGSLQATAAIDWYAANPAVIMTVPTTTWVANIPYQISYTTNTAPCTQSGGVPGDGWGTASGLNVAHTVTETAPGTYTFGVTCGTGSSTAQSQLTVTVPPPAVTISTNASTVTAGQPFTLTWNSSIAPCTSIDSSGGVNWGGSSVYPNGTLSEFQLAPGSYTYSITCGSGAQTVQAATHVIIEASVPTSISANAAAAHLFTPVVLTWSAPQSATCTAGGGDGSDGWGGSIASSGTATVTADQPGTVTYSVNCSGQAASASVNFQSVDAAQPSVPEPSTSLSSDTASASLGHAVTLTWNAQNSNLCIATGGNSADGWNGTRTTSGSIPIVESTAGSYTYMLTCTGAPPASMAKVTVTFSDSSASGGGSTSSGGGKGGGGVLQLAWILLLGLALAARQLALVARQLRSAAQMTVEEPDHHLEGILRLRNVRVVEESVKQPFPHMELGFYAELHQLLVRIQRGARLKVACPRDDQRRREFRQDLCGVDGRNQSVFQVRVAEIAQRRPCS